MKKSDLLIFIGPPGSGKGSLAQMCVKKLGWEQVSTGDLCRQHIERGTEIGKRIDFIIKSGSLIPDDLVTSMVQEWFLKHSKFDSTVILDGYPRNVTQAKAFDTWIKGNVFAFHMAVVHFLLDDDVVLKRISSRQVCQNKACQAVYSTELGSGFFPKKVGICDRCGSVVAKREDDTYEIIQRRLEVYHQHEREFLDFYKKMGYPIHEIDVNGPFEGIVCQFKQKVGVQDL